MIITCPQYEVFPPSKPDKTDSKEECILGGETVLTGKSPPHQFPVEHSIKNSLPVKRTAYRQGEKYEIRPIEKMVNNPFRAELPYISDDKYWYFHT